MAYYKTCFRDGVRNTEIKTISEEEFTKTLLRIIYNKQCGLPYNLHTESHNTRTWVETDWFGTYEMHTTLDFYVLTFEKNGHRFVHVFEPEYEDYEPIFSGQRTLPEWYNRYFDETRSGGDK